MASIAAIGKRNDGAAPHKPASPEDSEGTSWLQNTDSKLQLEERDQDLAAARAANRELMTRINTTM